MLNSFLLRELREDDFDAHAIQILLLRARLLENYKGISAVQILIIQSCIDTAQ